MWVNVNMNGVILIVAVGAVLGVSAKLTVPVFIMDEDNVLRDWSVFANPFTKMKAEYFYDIVRESQRRAFVVIFTEEALCTEDISSKDEGGTPFNNLQYMLHAKKGRYIPAVVQPYVVMGDVFPTRRDHEYTPPSPPPPALEYLYVHLRDGNGSRVDTLREHDELMRRLYTDLQRTRPRPVVGFYLAKRNPVNIYKLNMVKSKVPPRPEITDDVLITSKGALFRLSGLSVSRGAAARSRAAVRDVPYLADEVYSKWSLSTIMTYIDIDLQFNFLFQHKGWILDSVALMEGGEEVGRTSMRVGAPWQFSYVCAEPLVVINNRDGSTLTISKYQIQPTYRHAEDMYPYPAGARRSAAYDRVLRDSPPGGKHPPPPGGKHASPPGGNDTEASPGNITSGPPLPAPPPAPSNDTGKGFGRSVNCGPYFNSHILTGLVVSVVCMSILTAGILMLMHCENNNRFDDPQGKEVITNIDVSGT